jgi:hypothetical protein
MKNEKKFPQMVNIWERQLLGNPALVPWSQFTEATGVTLATGITPAEFIIGQLAMAATALLLDPEVLPADREKLWNQCTALAFNTAVAANCLGLLDSPPSSDGKTGEPGAN